MVMGGGAAALCVALGEIGQGMPQDRRGAGNGEGAVGCGKAGAGGLGEVLVVEAGAGRPQPDVVGGDGAASAASAATVSFRSVAASTVGTTQSSPFCASVIRNSSQPRGLTGGNRVLRW
jgi:hypothetical protein